MTALAFERPTFTRAELAGAWGGQGGCGNPGLYLLSHGTAELLTGAQRAILREGDAALLLTGVPHVVRGDEHAVALSVSEIAARAVATEAGYWYAPPGTRAAEASATLSALTFGTRALANGFRRALPDVVFLRPRALDRSARSALMALHAECERGRAANSEVLLRLGEVVALQALERQLPETATWDGAVLGAATHALERLDSSWTVLELAHYAGLSRSRFCERFELCFGESPMRWLRRQRMLRAARALEVGESSVAEVAAKLGYASESAFRKAFQRELGRPARLRPAMRAR